MGRVARADALVASAQGAAVMPPDAMIVVFPDHIAPAIVCIVLALIVLVSLCEVIAGKKGKGRRR